MNFEPKIETSQSDMAGSQTVAPGEPVVYGDHAPSREPLPRSQRQPRRQKADRGLPADEELVKLAKEFLERQRKLWPKLATLALFGGNFQERLLRRLEHQPP